MSGAPPSETLFGHGDFETPTIQLQSDDGDNLVFVDVERHIDHTVEWDENEQRPIDGFLKVNLGSYKEPITTYRMSSDRGFLATVDRSSHEIRLWSIDKESLIATSFRVVPSHRFSPSSSSPITTFKFSANNKWLIIDQYSHNERPHIRKPHIYRSDEAVHQLWNIDHSQFVKFEAPEPHQNSSYFLDEISLGRGGNIFLAKFAVAAEKNSFYVGPGTPPVKRKVRVYDAKSYDRTNNRFAVLAFEFDELRRVRSILDPDWLIQYVEQLPDGVRTTGETYKKYKATYVHRNYLRNLNRSTFRSWNVGNEPIEAHAFLAMEGDKETVFLWNRMKNGERLIRPFEFGEFNQKEQQAIREAHEGVVSFIVTEDDLRKAGHFYSPKDQTFDPADDYFFQSLMGNHRHFIVSDGHLWGVTLADSVTPRLESLGGVSSRVTMSRDLRWLATGSDEGDLKIWDLQSNLLENSARTIPLEGRLQDLAFDPSIQRLATITWFGQYESKATTWNLRDGSRDAESHEFPRANYRLNWDPGSRWVLMAYTPDGGEIYQIGAKGTFCWDTADPHSRPYEIQYPTHAFIEFSPDGQFLLASKMERQCYIWETKNLAFLDPGPQHVVETVKPSYNAWRFRRNISGDYKLVDVNSRKSNAFALTTIADTDDRVWDLPIQTRQLTGAKTLDIANCEKIHVQSRRNRVVELKSDGNGLSQLSVHYPNDTKRHPDVWKPNFRNEDGEPYVNSNIDSKNGWLVAWLDEGNQLSLFDLFEEDLPRNIRTFDLGEAISNVDVEGPWIIVKTAQRSLAISINPSTKNIRKIVLGNLTTVGQMVNAPNGDALAVSFSDNTKLLLRQGDNIRQFDLSSNRSLGEMTFSSDGRKLAAVDWESKAILIWNLERWDMNNQPVKIDLGSYHSFLRYRLKLHFSRNSEMLVVGADLTTATFGGGVFNIQPSIESIIQNRRQKIREEEAVLAIWSISETASDKIYETDTSIRKIHSRTWHVTRDTRWLVVEKPNHKFELIELVNGLDTFELSPTDEIIGNLKAKTSELKNEPRMPRSTCWVNSSRNGKWMLIQTGSDVNLWDLSSKRPAKSKVVLSDVGFGALSFSDDSRYLIGQGRTGSIRVWDLQSQNLEDSKIDLPGTSEGFSDSIFLLPSDGGGTFFVTRVRDRIQFWPLDQAELIKAAKGAAQSELTEAEKRSLMIE